MRLPKRKPTIIPADARLLQGDPIEVDQSALTGESLPVVHKTGETVYSGSIVKQGEIEAVVQGTGKNTYFGKTASLVAEARTISHFQKAVLKIGDYLIVLAVALVVLILLVALFRGDKMMTTLQFALVLTVAAIPVAMPAVLSVTMAVGARVLAAKRAIVSRLASIEELAGMDVLCSDKTGTLTQNKLTLGEPFAVPGITADEVILSGALASRAENNDPIDLAVLAGAKDGARLSSYRVTHFQPFDPVHKRTEAEVSAPGGQTFKVAKGAVQIIVALAANHSGVEAQIEKAVNEFAFRGFRSLGCGPHGRPRPMAVSRRAAPVRPPARGFQSHHRADQTNGHQDEDGDGRPGCHRAGDSKAIGFGSQYHGRPRLLGN